MELIFDHSLVTGNTMIDSQHYEIIKAVNELLECCKKGDGKVAAVRALDYLADYVDYHFHVEEDILTKVGYPQLEEHIKEHEKLTQVVLELQEMLREEEGPSEEFVKQVEHHFVNWIVLHIKKSDKDLAEYMRR